MKNKIKLPQLAWFGTREQEFDKIIDIAIIDMLV
jgi:hypothetical protein